MSEMYIRDVFAERQKIISSTLSQIEESLAGKKFRVYVKDYRALNNLEKISPVERDTIQQTAEHDAHVDVNNTPEGYQNWLFQHLSRYGSIDIRDPEFIMGLERFKGEMGSVFNSEMFVAVFRGVDRDVDYLKRSIDITGMAKLPEDSETSAGLERLCNKYRTMDTTLPRPDVACRVGLAEFIEGVKVAGTEKFNFYEAYDYLKNRFPMTRITPEEFDKILPEIKNLTDRPREEGTDSPRSKKRVRGFIRNLASEIYNEVL